MLPIRDARNIGLNLVVSLSLTVGFAAGAGALGGQEATFVEAGAPRTVAPVILESIDETPESTTLEAPAPPGPDVADVAVETPIAAPPTTLVELLEGIDVARRGIVMIDVELVDPAGETAAAAVEAHWRAGDFGQALDGLRALETDGRVAGIGIDWGDSGGSLKDWTQDTRVGGTRTEALELRLDFHTSSGNLFSVIRWGSTTGTSAWTVNLSTDFGDTWTETYSFASSVGIIGTAAVVVDDDVYVAYVPGNATDEGRLRRASAITGAIDSGYGFVTVVDGGAANAEEVSLAANPDDWDNRIYYLALMDDDSLRYLFDDAADGTTFTDASPPASATP
ncbi:MAG: hypothetical protein PVG53_04375 [Holophagae bacterium]|jgi:hypothetical protein